MRVKRIREVKDYKIRYLNFRNEAKFIVLRAIIKNPYIRSEFRILGRYLLYKFSLKAKFPNNFQNRCLVTGRVRATIPYFKLSRIEFRRLAKQNRLMGVKKSSWLTYYNTDILIYIYIYKYYSIQWVFL